LPNSKSENTESKFLEKLPVALVKKEFNNPISFRRIF